MEIKNLNKEDLLSLRYDEYDYLVNTSFETENISNIVTNYGILLGYNPIFKTPRIKIINIDTNKCFVIILETLEIIGDYDSNELTPNIINNLNRWIKLNYKDIYEFSINSNMEIDSFNFLDNLKSL